MTLLKIGDFVKNIIKTANDNFTEIDEKLSRGSTTLKVIYDASANIPSKSSGSKTTITLLDDATKYDGLIFQRDGTNATQFFVPPSIGQVYKVVNTQADFELVEGMNLYMFNAKLTATNRMEIYNNVYSGVKTSAAGRYMESFGDVPLTKIIAIKIN